MPTPRMEKPSWLALLFLLATTALAQSSTRSTSSTRTTTTATDAPFWTYTSRLMRSTGVIESTYTYGSYRTSPSIYTYTTREMRTIKDGVTPTATPSLITTSSDSYYQSLSDLQIIVAYYTPGSVADSDLEPEYDPFSTTASRTTTTYIEFLMPVTWTAPASCTGSSSTSFAVTTSITATVPSQVRDQVTPTSKVTGSTSSGYYGYVYATETWYLSAGAAPSTNDYYYTSYAAQCTAPPNYGRSSNTGSNDFNSLEVCAWYSGCTSLRTWIIIIACVIPGIFLLGFVESYFWFRRLMVGKSCLRFGTALWILLSLWVACFTRTQSARSKDDQKLLRENWKKVSAGQALKLWFKYGFRHRYPVALLGQYSRNTVGIVPEDAPLPQMGQVNSTFPHGGSTATGIIYHNGQPYYAPPQGWAPPNGQANPIPPPGTAYMPPQHGAPVYYGEHYGPPPQAKDASTVDVSPIQQHATPHPVSAPNTVPTPPSNAGEAYASPTHQLQPGELPTMSGAQPSPHTQGPPPSRPT